MPRINALQEPSEELVLDIAAVEQIDALPQMLQVLCELSGLGFAAVARVSDEQWVACAVHDCIQFGMKVGQRLDIHTTLCKEVRAERTAIVIDSAGIDERYCTHPTPRTYGFESYVSVPVILANGDYFGNLCALDRTPRAVSNPQIRLMFESFARLIAEQIDLRAQHRRERDALLNKDVVGNLRGMFLAIMAHDLRSPLQELDSAATKIETMTWDPALRRLAETIRSKGRKMSELIEEILQHARDRRRGGMPLCIENIDDLALDLNYILADVSAAHPQRRIIANIHIDRPVRCDADRIRQLASNLLSNALEHGAAHSPISFTAALDKRTLKIAVWNEGPALTKKRRGTLFQPFWRRTNDQGAVPLGLQICFEIARAHAGSIKVSSSEIKGTQFTARIPI